MSTPASALGAAGGALSGAAGLIDAVGNLLPTTTTAKGHTETKASASSATTGGELSIGNTSTIGSEKTSNNSSNASQNSTAGSSGEFGTNKSTTTSSGQSSENFSGQSNSTTTQTMLTDEGVMRIVNMMLQGTGGIPGLQETVSGERNAGVFNSSTNSLLSTNLVSTIAGEVARLSAPTVQTQNLGATNTQTNNNTSTLADAITSVMSNMNQSSASRETGSSSGQSSSQQDVLNMVLGLAQQFTDQESESVTDNKTKTKTKKFPTYICTFLQEVLPEYEGSREFKALEEWKANYLVPNKPFTIAKYDRIGPPIVAKLMELPENIKLSEAERIRTEFIIPAAEAYESGDSAEALSIYSEMVYSLQDTYIRGA